MKNLVSDRGIYQPLDELLALPPVRALRAMLYFDWLAGDELYEALEHYGLVRGDALNHTLMRLARQGSLERRPAPMAYGAPSAYAYRITASGRRELDAVVRRSAPERELGALPEGWNDDDRRPAWWRERAKKIARSTSRNASAARRAGRRSA